MDILEEYGNCIFFCKIYTKGSFSQFQELDGEYLFYFHGYILKTS